MNDIYDKYNAEREIEYLEELFVCFDCWIVELV